MHGHLRQAERYHSLRKELENPNRKATSYDPNCKARGYVTDFDWVWVQPVSVWLERAIWPFVNAFFLSPKYGCQSLGHRSLPHVFPTRRWRSQGYYYEPKGHQAIDFWGARHQNGRSRAGYASKRGWKIERQRCAERNTRRRWRSRRGRWEERTNRDSH